MSTEQQQEVSSQQPKETNRPAQAVEEVKPVVEKKILCKPQTMPICSKQPLFLSLTYFNIYRQTIAKPQTRRPISKLH